MLINVEKRTETLTLPSSSEFEINFKFHQLQKSPLYFFTFYIEINFIISDIFSIKNMFLDPVY